MLTSLQDKQNLLYNGLLEENYVLTNEIKTSVALRYIDQTYLKTCISFSLSSNSSIDVLLAAPCVSSSSLTDVHCPLTDVHCPLTNVLCPLTNVLCPLTDVLCPLTNVHCSLTDVHFPLTDV